MAKVTMDTVMEGELTISRSVSVSGGNLPREMSAVIPVTVDFNGVSVKQVLGWAMSSRIIDLQRVLRGMEREFVTSLVRDGLRRHATEMGEKIITEAQRMELLKRQLTTMSETERQAMLKLLTGDK